MTKVLFSFAVFWFVSGAVGLFGAAGALSPAAFQLATATPAGMANPATNAGVTKLIRIFTGTGYFDDALAQSLRPMLAKAFPSSNPAPAQSVPAVTIAVPTTPESQKKVVAAHP